jgi:hypothetical protein
MRSRSIFSELDRPPLSVHASKAPEAERDMAAPIRVGAAPGGERGGRERFKKIVNNKKPG